MTAASQLPTRGVRADADGRATSVGALLPVWLRAHGVDTVFGLPGVHSLELYRSLDTAGVRHVGARHEQGAAFMADGYARATGLPGVAFVISGPGVTNASTAIGQAYSDSIPVLLISAAISTDAMGMDRGMLHEITDQRAVTAPLTGLSMVSVQPGQVPEQLARAFGRFGASRPRPVHLSVPVDVLEAPIEAPGHVPRVPQRPGPDPAAIARLAHDLAAARRPVILAGGGAVAAADAIRQLVERLGAVFVSTVAGKGILPETHPSSVGSTLQRLATRALIADADFVLAVGTEIAEPDLYVTADAESSGVDPLLLKPRLLVRGRFARIDIDVDVAVRDYHPEHVIVSDARLATLALLDALPRGHIAVEQVRQATIVRETVCTGLSKLERAHDQLLRALRTALPDDALVYADMTQLAYTGCVTFESRQPRVWHFPMGFGTLGYALPAAVGAKVARPERAAIAIVGDGGFQFTLQELGTAVELGLTLPIVLWDNGALAEIADFMKARSIPQVDVHPTNPDFAVLARAYGCGYRRARTASEAARALASALQADGPTLLHLVQSDFVESPG